MEDHTQVMYINSEIDPSMEGTSTAYNLNQDFPMVVEEEVVIVNEDGSIFLDQVEEAHPKKKVITVSDMNSRNPPYMPAQEQSVRHMDYWEDGETEVILEETVEPEPDGEAIEVKNSVRNFGITTTTYGIYEQNRNGRKKFSNVKEILKYKFHLPKLFHTCSNLRTVNKNDHDFVFSDYTLLPAQSFATDGKYFGRTGQNSSLDRTIISSTREPMHLTSTYNSKWMGGVGVVSWEATEYNFYYPAPHRADTARFPHYLLFFQEHFSKFVNWLRPNDINFFQPGSNVEQQKDRLWNAYWETRKRYAKFLYDPIIEQEVGHAFEEIAPIREVLFVFHHLGLHIPGFIKFLKSRSGKICLYDSWNDAFFGLFVEPVPYTWRLADKLAFFYLTRKGLHDLEKKFKTQGEPPPEIKRGPKPSVARIQQKIAPSQPIEQPQETILKPNVKRAQEMKIYGELASERTSKYPVIAWEVHHGRFKKCLGNVTHCNQSMYRTITHEKARPVLLYDCAIEESACEIVANADYMPERYNFMSMDPESDIEDDIETWKTDPVMAFKVMNDQRDDFIYVYMGDINSKFERFRQSTLLAGRALVHKHPNVDLTNRHRGDYCVLVVPQVPKDIYRKRVPIVKSRYLNDIELVLRNCPDRYYPQRQVPQLYEFGRFAYGVDIKKLGSAEERFAIRAPVQDWRKPRKDIKDYQGVKCFSAYDSGRPSRAFEKRNSSVQAIKKVAKLFSQTGISSKLLNMCTTFDPYQKISITENSGGTQETSQSSQSRSRSESKSENSHGTGTMITSPVNDTVEVSPMLRSPSIATSLKRAQATPTPKRVYTVVNTVQKRYSVVQQPYLNEPSTTPRVSSLNVTPSRSGTQTLSGVQSGVKIQESNPSTTMVARTTPKSTTPQVARVQPSIAAAEIHSHISGTPQAARCLPLHTVRTVIKQQAEAATRTGISPAAAAGFRFATPSTVTAVRTTPLSGAAPITRIPTANEGNRAVPLHTRTVISSATGLAVPSRKLLTVNGSLTQAPSSSQRYRRIDDVSIMQKMPGAMQSVPQRSKSTHSPIQRRNIPRNVQGYMLEDIPYPQTEQQKRTSSLRLKKENSDDNVDDAFRKRFLGVSELRKPSLPPSSPPPLSPLKSKKDNTDDDRNNPRDDAFRKRFLVLRNDQIEVEKSNQDQSSSGENTSSHICHATEHLEKTNRKGNNNEEIVDPWMITITTSESRPKKENTSSQRTSSPPPTLTAENSSHLENSKTISPQNEETSKKTKRGRPRKGESTKEDIFAVEPVKYLNQQTSTRHIGKQPEYRGLPPATKTRNSDASPHERAKTAHELVRMLPGYNMPEPKKKVGRSKVIAHSRGKKGAFEKKVLLAMIQNVDPSLVPEHNRLSPDELATYVEIGRQRDIIAQTMGAGQKQPKARQPIGPDQRHFGPPKKPKVKTVPGRRRRRARSVLMKRKGHRNAEDERRRKDKITNHVAAALAFLDPDIQQKLHKLLKKNKCTEIVQMTFTPPEIGDKAIHFVFTALDSRKAVHELNLVVETQIKEENYEQRVKGFLYAAGKILEYYQVSSTNKSDFSGLDDETDRQEEEVELTTAIQLSQRKTVSEMTHDELLGLDIEDAMRPGPSGIPREEFLPRRVIDDETNNPAINSNAVELKKKVKWRPQNKVQSSDNQSTASSIAIEEGRDKISKEATVVVEVPSVEPIAEIVMEDSSCEVSVPVAFVETKDVILDRDNNISLEESLIATQSSQEIQGIADASQDTEEKEETIVREVVPQANAEVFILGHDAVKDALSSELNHDVIEKTTLITIEKASCCQNIPEALTSQSSVEPIILENLTGDILQSEVVEVILPQESTTDVSSIDVVEPMVEPIEIIHLQDLAETGSHPNILEAVSLQDTIEVIDLQYPTEAIHHSIVTSPKVIAQSVSPQDATIATKNPEYMDHLINNVDHLLSSEVEENQCEEMETETDLNELLEILKESMHPLGGTDNNDQPSSNLTELIGRIPKSICVGTTRGEPDEEFVTTLDNSVATPTTVTSDNTAPVEDEPAQVQIEKSDSFHSAKVEVRTFNEELSDSSESKQCIVQATTDANTQDSVKHMPISTPTDIESRLSPDFTESGPSSERSQTVNLENILKETTELKNLYKHQMLPVDQTTTGGTEVESVAKEEIVLEVVKKALSPVIHSRADIVVIMEELQAAPDSAIINDNVFSANNVEANLQQAPQDCTEATKEEKKVVEEPVLKKDHIVFEIEQLGQQTGSSWSTDKVIAPKKEKTLELKQYVADNNQHYGSDESERTDDESTPDMNNVPRDRLFSEASGLSEYPIGSGQFTAVVRTPSLSESPPPTPMHAAEADLGPEEGIVAEPILTGEPVYPKRLTPADEQEEARLMDIQPSAPLQIRNRISPEPMDEPLIYERSCLPPLRLPQRPVMSPPQPQLYQPSQPIFSSSHLSQGMPHMPPQGYHLHPQHQPMQQPPPFQATPISYQPSMYPQFTNMSANYSRGHYSAFDTFNPNQVAETQHSEWSLRIRHQPFIDSHQGIVHQPTAWRTSSIQSQHFPQQQLPSPYSSSPLSRPTPGLQQIPNPYPTPVFIDGKWVYQTEKPDVPQYPRNVPIPMPSQSGVPPTPFQNRPVLPPRSSASPTNVQHQPVTQRQPLVSSEPSQEKLRNAVNLQLDLYIKKMVDEAELGQLKELESDQMTASSSIKVAHHKADEVGATRTFVDTKGEAPVSNIREQTPPKNEPLLEAARLQEDTKKSTPIKSVEEPLSTKETFLVTTIQAQAATKETIIEKASSLEVTQEEDTIENVVLRKSDWIKTREQLKIAHPSPQNIKLEDLLEDNAKDIKFEYEMKKSSKREKLSPEVNFEEVKPRDVKLLNHSEQMRSSVVQTEFDENDKQSYTFIFNCMDRMLKSINFIEDNNISSNLVVSIVRQLRDCLNYESFYNIVVECYRVEVDKLRTGLKEVKTQLERSELQNAERSPLMCREPSAAIIPTLLPAICFHVGGKIVDKAKYTASTAPEAKFYACNHQDAKKEIKTLREQIAMYINLLPDICFEKGQAEISTKHCFVFNYKLHNPHNNDVVGSHQFIAVHGLLIHEDEAGKMTKFGPFRPFRLNQNGIIKTKVCGQLTGVELDKTSTEICDLLYYNDVAQVATMLCTVTKLEKIQTHEKLIHAICPEILQGCFANQQKLDEASRNMHLLVRKSKKYEEIKEEGHIRLLINPQRAIDALQKYSLQNINVFIPSQQLVELKSMVAKIATQFGNIENFMKRHASMAASLESDAMNEIKNYTVGMNRRLMKPVKVLYYYHVAYRAMVFIGVSRVLQAFFNPWRVLEWLSGLKPALNIDNAIEVIFTGFANTFNKQSFRKNIEKIFYCLENIKDFSESDQEQMITSILMENIRSIPLSDEMFKFMAGFNNIKDYGLTAWNSIEYPAEDTIEKGIVSLEAILRNTDKQDNYWKATKHEQKRLLTELITNSKPNQKEYDNAFGLFEAIEELPYDKSMDEDIVRRLPNAEFNLKACFVHYLTEKIARERSQNQDLLKEVIKNMNKIYKECVDTQQLIEPVQAQFVFDMKADSFGLKFNILSLPEDKKEDEMADLPNFPPGAGGPTGPNKRKPPQYDDENNGNDGGIDNQKSRGTGFKRQKIAGDQQDQCKSHVNLTDYWKVSGQPSLPSCSFANDWDSMSRVFSVASDDSGFNSLPSLNNSKRPKKRKHEDIQMLSKEPICSIEPSVVVEEISEKVTTKQGLMENTLKLEPELTNVDLLLTVSITPTPEFQETHLCAPDQIAMPSATKSDISQMLSPESGSNMDNQDRRMSIQRIRIEALMDQLTEEVKRSSTQNSSCGSDDSEALDLRASSMSELTIDIPQQKKRRLSLHTSASSSNQSTPYSTPSMTPMITPADRVHTTIEDEDTIRDSRKKFLPKKEKAEEHHFHFKSRYTKDWYSAIATIVKSKRAARGKKSDEYPTLEAQHVHHLYCSGKTQLKMILKGSKLDFKEMEREYDLQKKLQQGSTRDTVLPQHDSRYSGMSSMQRLNLSFTNPLFYYKNHLPESSPSGPLDLSMNGLYHSYSSVCSPTASQLSPAAQYKPKIITKAALKYHENPVLTPKSSLINGNNDSILPQKDGPEYEWSNSSTTDVNEMMQEEIELFDVDDQQIQVLDYFKPGPSCEQSKAVGAKQGESSTKLKNEKAVAFSSRRIKKAVTKKQRQNITNDNDGGDRSRPVLIELLQSVQKHTLQRQRIHGKAKTRRLTSKTINVESYQISSESEGGDSDLDRSLVIDTDEDEDEGIVLIEDESEVIPEVTIPFPTETVTKPQEVQSKEETPLISSQPIKWKTKMMIRHELGKTIHYRNMELIRENMLCAEAERKNMFDMNRRYPSRCNTYEVLSDEVKRTPMRKWKSVDYFFGRTLAQQYGKHWDNYMEAVKYNKRSAPQESFTETEEAQSCSSTAHIFSCDDFLECPRYVYPKKLRFPRTEMFERSISRDFRQDFHFLSQSRAISLHYSVNGMPV